MSPSFPANLPCACPQHVVRSPARERQWHQDLRSFPYDVRWRRRRSREATFGPRLPALGRRAARPPARRAGLGGGRVSRSDGRPVGHAGWGWAWSTREPPLRGSIAALAAEWTGWNLSRAGGRLGMAGFPQPGVCSVYPPAPPSSPEAAAFPFKDRLPTRNLRGYCDGRHDGRSHWKPTGRVRCRIRRAPADVWAVVDAQHARGRNGLPPPMVTMTMESSRRGTTGSRSGIRAGKFDGMR
jgi:hypothetical protein